MKEARLVIWVAILLWVSFLIFAIIMYDGDPEQRALESRVKQLEEQVELLSRRDSLIREHYKECMFLSKESVEVGHDNYLRVKHGNFRITETD
jgi:hypothetical protein